MGFYSARSDLQQAYRLYTLAMGGFPEIGAMNRLREMKNLSSEAYWILAAAYAHAGYPEVASSLISPLNTEIKHYQEMGTTYGSSLRDRAMILETLVLLDRKDDAARLFKEIASQLAGRYWYSTQSVAMALHACSRFVGENKLGEEIDFVYKVEGSSEVQAGTQKPLILVDIEEDAIRGKKLLIRNSGTKMIFIQMIQSGQPLGMAIEDASSGINLDIKYKNTKGLKIDPSQIVQGTDFMVEMTVKNNSIIRKHFQNLALSHGFPSGWEIINTRMDDLQKDKSKVGRFDYQVLLPDQQKCFVLT